jgi:hypothetical protein
LEKTEKLLKKVEAVPVVFKFVGSGTPKGPSIHSFVVTCDTPHKAVIAQNHGT